MATSQAKVTAGKSSELRKRVLLGGLVAALAIVIYIQFFTGDQAPRSTASNTAGNTNRPTTTPTPSRAIAPRPSGGTPEPIVSTPLPILAMMSKNAASSGTGRNIFVYPPPPTPTPPPPTPPPSPVPTPPVNLFSVNPAGVIARTGGFTLTVFGDKFPADSQGFLNGREFPTTFISATEVKMQIPADAIASPGNLGVQVRSKSDAKLYSNQASLNVAAPPDPPYTYIGLIVGRNGMMAVLKSQADDKVENVFKDRVIGGHWKIVSISPQKIEIEDTNIHIFHTVAFTGDDKGR